MIPVTIRYLGGQCPVQAEGAIDGKPFYFRARGSSWSIGIGGDAVMNPEWSYRQQYGTGPYDAGWMDISEARDFIFYAIGKYESRGLLEALRAVEIARHSDSEADWKHATELSDEAIAKAEGRVNG